jgi:hypothetical protein
VIEPVVLFVYALVAVIVFIWFSYDYKFSAMRLAIFWPLYAARWFVTNLIIAAKGEK